jgi:hypothetical protein
MSPELLEPDGDQLEIFVEGVFRHCGDRGAVSLRAFYEFDSKKPFRITSVPLTGGLKFLMEVAVDDARRAAQDPKPVVFCPPLAVFDASVKGRAREEDILEAPALSVELDQNPRVALAALERIIGPATLVIRSGGQWIDPASGEPQDRLHGHWRFDQPVRGPDVRTKLKRARRLATVLAGGDPSNVPACHPIRWPGSWHRKAAPRLCKIIDLGHLDDEIDLDQALAALEAAVPDPSIAKPNGADAAGDPLDWQASFAAVLSGESYHPAVTPLAASFARWGAPEPVADNVLRSLLLNSRPADSLRLRRRDAELAKLPETVRSAYDKFAKGGGRQGPGQQQEHEAPPLNEWDAGDDPGPIPPRQWLLGNQFCLGFISSLVAAGGVGKSALRLLQFISLALGRPLCGQHVFKRCRVLLISLEDDRDELQRRIQAVLNFFKIDRTELRGWMFCATPIGSRLAESHGKKGRDIGPLDQQIREAIARIAPLVVGLDPFIKLHSLNENDSGDMNFVCDLLGRLAVETKIAVDIPHHVHKGSIAPGDADAGRGSSGIKDAGRLTYTLTPMSLDEANAFGVNPEERFSYVRLDSAKVNIAPRGDKAVWFHLIGQPINNETPDYPNGDNIQVAEPWSPPATWAGLDNRTLNAILDAIDVGMEDGERFSGAPSAKSRAAWRAVQAIAPDKTENQCREIVRQWIKNGVLVEEIYESPTRRASRRGLRVVNANRPGSRTDT